LNPHPTRSFSQLRFFLGLIVAFGSQPALASAPPVVADAQIALASGLQLPEGIAIAKNGTIYVADTQSNQVVTVSSAGVLTPVSTPGYTLSGPGAVAVDSAGDLFIADSNNARVLKKVSATGAVSEVLGSQALSYPAALTFDPAGDLYIGDAVKLAIYKVTAAVLAQGGNTATTVTISNVSNLFPGALATDSSGDLYIADANSNNIYQLPAGKTTAQTVNPTGFPLISPSGLALDAAGNLYVLDGGNTRIVEVPEAPGGAPYLVPVTGLAAPTSLALDPQGNLYVTDETNNNVTQLIYAGNAVNLGEIAVGSTGAAATINYELNTPETLTAFHVTMQGDAASEASLATGTTCQFQSYTVSPTGSSNPITATNPFHCVAKVQGVPAYPGVRNGAINLLGSSSALLISVPFTETGSAPVAAIFPGVATTAVSGFEQPQGLAISPENDIVYIADSSSGEVYSWKGLNGTSSPLTQVSTAPVALSQPDAVALDGAGDLFIADFALAKIVVVPANTAIAPYTLATGSVLDHPIALIIDADGDLYIGDAGPAGLSASSTQPGFVVKVPPSGAPISVVNTSATHVVYPQVLTTDAVGNLYIADGGPASGPGQVVFVPQDGAAASALDIPGLIDPSGLVVDPAGQLWVLDEDDLNQITILPPNGGSLYTVPLVAPNLGAPSLMAFTAGARNLLISDIEYDDLVLVSGTQAQLSYPQTAVGAQSAAQPASIVSIGNTALKPTTAGDLYSFTGNTQDFQVQNTSTCLSFTQLLPAQSCAFSATFAPISAGAESESITSIFNSAAQVQLLLSGSTTSSSSVAASPTFSLDSGTYNAAQAVKLADATSGAQIYYTTNGTTPTTSSVVYHSAISVSGPETINAIAVASGFTRSPVASATYSFGPTAVPTITLATGAYAMPVSTTITDSTSGANILWCSVSSGTCAPATSYTAAISIDPTTTETICANATDSGHVQSATACHTYTNSK
jgi:sugar lactone lactonase YvrE